MLVERHADALGQSMAEVGVVEAEVAISTVVLVGSRGAESRHSEYFGTPWQDALLIVLGLSVEEVFRRNAHDTNMSTPAIFFFQSYNTADFGCLLIIEDLGV